MPTQISKFRIANLSDQPDLVGEILKVAHPSMVVEASVTDWEAWTDMRFPESGDYVVPHALSSVQIDLAMDIGRYIEPNV